MCICGMLNWSLLNMPMGGFAGSHGSSNFSFCTLTLTSIVAMPVCITDSDV